jgi:hypothetical protein
VATSTFGGGGGTKVFCSQALNTANADMTNARREAVAALYKRKDFITVPQLQLFQYRRLIEEAFRIPLIAIIRLQWNPKPKMMRPAQVALPKDKPGLTS